MSVNGIDNKSNNVALYTAAGTAIGGLSGALAGYYSKPFLKNDAPTDAFVKESSDLVSKLGQENLPDDVKELLSSVALDETKFDGFKNVEEYKNSLKQGLGEMLSAVPEEDINLFKESALLSNDIFSSLGAETSAEFTEKFKNAKTMEECKNVIFESIDRDLEGKSLAQIKQEMIENSNTLKKNFVKEMFNQVWDSNKKEFVQGEEGSFAAIFKKAAKNIQMKTAGIYAAIGAGVLGLGTYIISQNNKK